MNSLSKMLSLAVLLAIMTAFLACSKNDSFRPSTGLIEEQSGMFGKKIKIRTQPTKARIFINEREIGESPLTYEVTHSEQRMLNIKAIPMYPNQYSQNIFLMVPPIPKAMTIYMNHIPENYDRTKDKPFTPPEKPEPIVITNVEVDTVYIDRTTKEPYLVTIPIIYFDTDKFDILRSEEDKLQTLITALKHYQDLSVEIYGFADRRNTEDYNRTLSLNRATAVKDYLVRNGIKESRMRTFGHGIARMVDKTGTEMDLQENRKVIFVLRK